MGMSNGIGTIAGLLCPIAIDYITESRVIIPFHSIHSASLHSLPLPVCLPRVSIQTHIFHSYHPFNTLHWFHYTCYKFFVSWNESGIFYFSLIQRGGVVFPIQSPPCNIYCIFYKYYLPSSIMNFFFLLCVVHRCCCCSYAPPTFFADAQKSMIEIFALYITIVQYVISALCMVASTSLKFRSARVHRTITSSYMYVWWWYSGYYVRMQFMQR